MNVNGDWAGATHGAGEAASSADKAQGCEASGAPARNSCFRQARSGGTGRSAGRRPAGQGVSSKTHPAKGGAIAKEAGRLLAALAEADAFGIADPFEDGMLMVRKSRGAVSVGAGRFALALADDLVRHDLAAWETSGTSQRMLRMSAPGAAHLKRASTGSADAFRDQHLATDDVTLSTEDGPVRVRVDLEESPLDWLRRRRDRDGAPLIDKASYQAGERLRADITVAGLLPSVTSRWDPVRSTGGARGPADATDRMVAARQRIRHAFESVGADFGDLLIDLCGSLKGLETIERERRWPPRSAKVVVRIALARLAEHYGLEAAATGPAARRIRAWQAVVIEGGLNAT